ncbi:hypothetical protein OBBRIDRAFT_738643 [Obba rivulosa]|uniref:DRBM domain-containing protein n=1 Tax=Obba rivulosa TaxID=1052685 RepID=A0A8E2DGM8_9APHY|nr:hypothetical protein OBBRIDRAFT_738643 [Obba rivulosa]
MVALLSLLCDVDTRMQLNNTLQRLGWSTDSLQWSDQSSGPRHAPFWTSYVYINGTLYGQGQGANKDTSREAAAAQAYRTLAHQYNII